MIMQYAGNTSYHTLTLSLQPGNRLSCVKAYIVPSGHFGFIVTTLSIKKYLTMSVNISRGRTAKFLIIEQTESVGDQQQSTENEKQIGGKFSFGVQILAIEIL